ncbi:AraC family transcriptional regulator ligand-binding domain-containing protein [Nocardia sp. XZ_19_385]|uniref:AraC family transcriptional regulator n=1 Tax=Nocardia sp. XZ_19_385 TaxID=2769488 RepID=UPI002814BE8E|nr:AraC family transcriptional regulator ligand-binding domain-containing protein [Nocardia sp. XZ_19_385]
MDHWEWRRSVLNSVVVAEVGEAHGLGPDDLLRGTGIDKQLLSDPAGEVTAAQELALIRNLVTRLGDPPGLGIEVGLRNRLTMHGVYGLAILSSPTMRAALSLAVRYIGLTTSFSRAWQATDGAEVLVFYDDTEVPGDLRGFLMERDATSLVVDYAMIGEGPPPLRRIEVAGGLHARLRPIFEPQGVVCVEGADPHLLVFDGAGLERPLPLASPLTAQLFEKECAELLERRGLHRGIAGAVREVLMRRLHGRVSQEDVAAGLHMSLRTMRRRLAEEGTSYRQLCAETYGSLAEDLLSTGLTVEDVANRMGYAGAPSFSNAFKQWRGVSPGHFARNFAVHSHQPAVAR